MQFEVKLGNLVAGSDLHFATLKDSVLTSQINAACSNAERIAVVLNVSCKKRCVGWGEFMDLADLNVVS